MRTIDIERRVMPNTYVKQLAQELGQAACITAGTGIGPDELAGYTKPITVAQHLRMLRNALPLAPGPDWYLRWGQRMGEHFHGPVSLAWMSAPTLGAGFDVFLRYIPGRVPYLNWQGQVEGGMFAAEVRPLMSFGALTPMLVEVPLLVMHEYVRRLRPGSLAQGAHIELAYPAPPHAALYARWFECPVRFDAPRNALVMPAAWRELPNVGHDEAIWDVACNRCRTLCGSSQERDTLTLVRQILFDSLDHDPPAGGFGPSLEAVAARLHCSPRTLIRRLKALNTSYHEVVDKVKKQRACELLANEQLRIHEIADALGYGDAGGFVRSFKRCLGVTPGRYREQMIRVPPVPEDSLAA